MQAAAKTAGQLDKVEVLEGQKDPAHVSLFAVSADGQIYAKDLEEKEARNPENPLYPFFAYTQQVLAAFREEQSKAQENTATEKK